MKELIKKIEEACPEYTNQEIGLAEVLRTLELFSNKHIILCTDGRMGEINDVFSNGFSGRPQWNMTGDLAVQSKEIVDFLLIALNP